MLLRIIRSSPSYIVPSCFSLLALILYTRTMEVEEFGLYSLTIVTIELIQAVLFQWIKLSLARFYHNKEWRSSDLTTTTFLMNLSITVIALLAVFIAVLANNEHIELISVIGMSIIIKGWGNFFAEYYRIAYDNLNKYTVYSILFSIVSITPGLILILFIETPRVVDILKINAVIASIFLAYILITNYNTFSNGSFDKKLLKLTCLYGGPLILVVLASSLGTRLDRFIIEELKGLKELAYYSAAYSLSNMLISSLVLVLTIPTYPQIMKLLGEGKLREAKNIYRNNGELMFIFCVPIITIGVWESKGLCNLILGESIAVETGKVLPYILVFALFYNLKQHFFDQSFQFAKKTNYTLLLAIPASLIQFILGWFLVQKIGIRGMAISGIIVYLLSIITTYFLTRKLFEIEISWNTFIKTILLSSLSALVIINIKLDYKENLEVILRCLLFTLLYSASVVLTVKSFSTPILGAKGSK